MSKGKAIDNFLKASYNKSLISNDSNVTDEECAAFAKKLPNDSQADIFYLSNNEISNMGIIAITKSLINGGNLT